MQPDPEIIARVERLLGSAPVLWRSVTGGHTQAGRSRVELADGRAAFCKWAVDEATAGWLRDETRVVGVLDAPFVPEVLAWEDAEAPLLVLEDLGADVWPPPWDPERARRGVAALRAVAAAVPPDGLPRLTALEEMLRGWRAVAADPAPFLGLGLVSGGWLERNLSTLRAAEDSTILEGDELLHLDARGDNMAVLPERVVLVDWNWACVGNAELDLAYFVNHIGATGGPSPDELGVSAAIDPGWAAVLAGYFAATAGLPDIPEAPTVRPAQREQLLYALPWATSLLDLEPPDGAHDR